MGIRTDLATEKTTQENKEKFKSYKNGYTEVNYFETKGEKVVSLLFCEVEKICDFTCLNEEILKALNTLLKRPLGTILCVALGNDEIVCDNIGPAIAKRILATRHIEKNIAQKIGLSGLLPTAVITPGVLGKTGIETAETVKALCDKICPEAVIVIDALCTEKSERIFRCIELSTIGIMPGSGVKNDRAEISKKTLGIPVISVGIPTVCEAESIAKELTGKEPESRSDLIVTPKDCDLYSRQLSIAVAQSINQFLQPEIEPQIIEKLV